jgi:hypothetical protein
MHSALAAQQHFDILVPLGNGSLNLDAYSGGHRVHFWEGTTPRSVLPSQTVPLKNGLQTPPPDMLGTDIYPVLPSSYGGQNKSRNPTLRPSSTLHNQSMPTSNSTDWTQGIGKTRTRIQSPRRGAQGASTVPEQASHKKSSSSGGNSSSSNQIVSYLQIPATINDSKGSLADFAAQVS